MTKENELTAEDIIKIKRDGAFALCRLMLLEKKDSERYNIQVNDAEFKIIIKRTK